MRAQAQFTIHTLNDVVTSKTAPASPYLGQLWVDTSQSPPITKVWNGSAWKEQNGTDTIRTSIKTVETKASNLETNLNGLTSTVSLISKTVETIESDTAEAQENILDLQSSVSTLEQTATDIELRVTQNEDNISSLTISHNSVAARVKTAEGNITTLKADVSGLKTRVSNAEGDISALEQDVGSITARVTNAEDDISILTVDVSGLEARVSDNEGNITTLTTSVNGITTRVTNAEGDISTLEQSVSSITTRVSNAEGDISELTTDLSGITARVTSAEGNITTLTTSVNGLQTRVTSAEGAISTLEQTAEELSAEVTSKADWSGGNQSSFGWSLTSSGFYLYSNGNTVMSVTSDGLNVTGTIYAHGGEIGNLTITETLYFGGNEDYYIDPNYDDGSYYINLPGIRIDDASGAVFSGRLSAPSGTIGGFTITTSAIYKTKTSYSSTTAGVYIGTDGIGLGAGTFYVTSAGALTAKSGTIGGFTIGTSSIYKTKTSYSSTTAGVYVGTDGIGLGAGTFYVTSAGALTAKSGTIGGFTIGTSSIYKTKTAYSNTTAGVYVGTDGIGLGAGTFYVTSAGALTAKSGTIGAWTISTSYIGSSQDGGSFYITSASDSSTYWIRAHNAAGGGGTRTFSVSKAGALYATSVDITGKITATSGTISNLTIDGKLTFGGNSSYYINANHSDTSWYIRLPGMRSDEASGTVFSGTLSAPSGTIGGWTIGTATLYCTIKNSDGTLKGTGFQAPSAGQWAIAVGYDSESSWANAPFRVNHSGALYATSATITGTFSNKKSSGLGLEISGSTVSFYNGSTKIGHITGGTGYIPWNNSSSTVSGIAVSSLLCADGGVRVGKSLQLSTGNGIYVSNKLALTMGQIKVQTATMTTRYLLFYCGLLVGIGSSAFSGISDYSSSTYSG